MKYFIIITIITLMISCDPEVCTTYIIENNSSKNLEIIFSSSSAYNDTVTISNGDYHLWFKECHLGGKTIVDFQIYDSICIKSGKENLLKYVSEKEGKNIYNYEYWDENKKKKRDYEYTFEITEEDIKQ